MKRKLFSLLLSAFALLLLMGAGLEPHAAVALTLVEEEQVIADEAMTPALVEEEEVATDAVAELESGTQETVTESAAQDMDPPAWLIPPEWIAPPEVEAIETDQKLLVNGVPASLETRRYVDYDVTYVSLRAMALELDEMATTQWDGSAGTLTIQCDRLTISAKRGDQYMVANGRYLYIPQGIQMVDDVLMVPLKAICKAFDAQVTWDGATGITTVTRGSGSIISGDEFYNQDDLFWLSRVIHAESGAEPLEGKMGVGIVVLNRVAHPAYPNTIQGVLAQRNQFSTYKNGGLANRTPNAGSVLAAKLVLDGGVVETIANATHFDSASNSWASRNKTFVAAIGGHKFYA